MDILIKLSQFLLSLSLLIVLHELGHFIPAKLFKTRVEKFYLFFDVKFSLFKKKIGDTVYGIGWLPLGGYVKIAGMVDESMDTEQLKSEPQPWEFRSKPAWQRLIIMLGGVTVNFVLAFLIYIGLAYTYGDLYISNKDIKHGVLVQSPALLDAGLKTGDNIIAIDGKEIERFNDLNEAILLGGGKAVTIEREGKEAKVDLPIDLIDKIMKDKGSGLVGLRIPFVVVGFQEGSVNAEKLKEHDIIQSLNGQDTPYNDQVAAILDANKGKTIEAVVKRNGELVTTELIVDPEGKLNVVYAGALPLNNLKELGLYTISKEKFGLIEAIPVGLDKGADRIASYWNQLKLMVKPETGAYKGVGGFKTMYDIFPSFWSWEVFWNITAMLSIMLAVMNLLPIPALDGGHVLFLLYEIISGRKPSDKFLENAQMIGFFILIGLLLFANGNDIYRAIFAK